MKLLTSRIRLASSWYDLQSALTMAREHERELDCIALAACFSALPRVLKKYSRLDTTQVREGHASIDVPTRKQHTHTHKLSNMHARVRVCTFAHAFTQTHSTRAHTLTNALAQAHTHTPAHTFAPVFF